MGQARGTFTDFVLDHLSELRGLRSRAMFGGQGLYCGDRFFGILFKGRLYFKVSAVTRPSYEAEGMGPFRPGKQRVLTMFYEVPPDIIEQPDTLLEWATQAVQCCTSTTASRSRSSGRPRRRQTRTATPR